MDPEFVEFCIAQGALSFGEFKLKSGRVSPYFFNAGLFNSGYAIEKLGYHFAKKIYDTLHPSEYDMIFGPAYKGIPLAVATSIALSHEFEIDKPYCFNRKEAKDHGDMGVFVGAQPKDGSRMVLVDDVFTTGGAKEEAIAQLSSVAKVSIAGVFIALDRQEKNEQGANSIKAFEGKYITKVHSVANATEIFDYLKGRKLGKAKKVIVKQDLYDKFLQYRKQYGV
jgi:orotate phosphoribosyltransferase